MVNVQLRPASKADVLTFLGKPFTESFRGIVAEKNGEVIGIAGVLHTLRLQAFSTITAEMKKHPKTIIKAVRLFREILNSYDTTIYAVASETERSSMRFLEHVGFEHYHERIYIWQQHQPG